MELQSSSRAWRLALAARTPGLDAARLEAIARLSADLELLERPDPGALAKLGLTAGGLGWLRSPDLASIEADLRWLENSGCTLLASTDAQYPELLRQSPDAPAVLYVRGNESL